jgi:hypothetical protein
VAVDVAPEVKWSSTSSYKNLRVTVKAPDDLAAQKAADAELLSRLKDLGSLQVAVGRGIEVVACFWTIQLHYDSFSFSLLS